MSPRRRFQPTRRRPKIRPSTDAVQATRSQAELAADARHEGLTVTHRFEPGSEGEPFAATIRFTGRREGIAGKPQPGDTFTVDERIEPPLSAGPLNFAVGRRVRAAGSRKRAAQQQIELLVLEPVDVVDRAPLLGAAAAFRRRNHVRSVGRVADGAL